MRTANPTLRPEVFQQAGLSDRGLTMTVSGVVQKTSILILLAMITASFTWGLGPRNPMLMPLSMGAALIGLVVALVTIFKKAWSPVTAPIYALIEGVFLGGISLIFETSYPGIVPQAVGLTFGTLFAMLMAYQSGLIKVTEKFKLGVAAATGSIFLVYMISMVLGFFGVRIPLIHEAGMVGIGFSLFVVVIAAMNLVLDFDMIEQGARGGAPKFMEWYAGFGLLVTLVWLYMEILRLLAKLRGGRR